MLVTASAKREAGYWMLDAGHCECGARSRIRDTGHCECGARSKMLVTASAEREAGY